MCILRSRLLRVSGIAAAIVCCGSNPAHAGPPLFADDPNTVGPGVVQSIFAVSTFSQGDRTLLRGPTADVTIGVVDSLDALVVASLVSRHDAAGSPRWSLGGVFAMGAKWEFFRRDRGSLALTPTLILDTRDPKKPAGLLPLQGELQVGGGKAVIGFDAGYVVVRNGADELFGALYANWAATARLNLLGEVWVFSLGVIDPADPNTKTAADFGMSLGIDCSIIGDELRLLASLGTGFVSLDAPRVDVRAYLGTQHTFGSRRERWRRAR